MAQAVNYDSDSMLWSKLPPKLLVCQGTAQHTFSENQNHQCAPVRDICLYKMRTMLKCVLVSVHLAGMHRTGLHFMGVHLIGRASYGIFAKFWVCP